MFSDRLEPPEANKTMVTLGRLMVVDDDAELVGALTEALTENGYEAMGYTSGRAALEAVKQQDFDVLLTDLVMPDLDGIGLLRAVKDADPHLVGIVMTGQGTVEGAVDAIQVGAFDYVIKPITISALRRVLARALEVRQLRRESFQLRESVAIYELSNAVASTLDLNTILDKVADAACNQTLADEVSIMLPTSEGDALYVAVARGANRGSILGQRITLDQGIAGWVTRHHELLILNGEIDDARFAPIRPRSDIRSAISLPMLVAGELVGVLNVNATRRRSFTMGQTKALTVLANIAASVIKTASLYNQAREAEETYRTQRKRAEVDRERAEEALRESNRRLEGARSMVREMQQQIVQQERLRALGQMARGVAHDFNNDLAMIVGFSELLLKLPYDLKNVEKARSYVQMIRTVAGDATNVVDRLREFFRQRQEGEVFLPVDLNQLAQEAVLLTQPKWKFQAQANGTNIRVDTELANLPPISGNASDLREALTNLILNAVDAMPNGGTLTIRTRVAGGQVCLEVADTGVGMTEEVWQRCLEPFFTTKGERGTGLGLAMVYGIVMRHDGAVNIQTVPGRGTTFIIRLPIAKVIA